MLNMVEAYIFKSKGVLERLKDKIIAKHDDFNYRVYVPEKNIILGYFSDEELTPSKKNFCETIYDKKEKDKLKQKINENKFLKEIKISEHSLEALTSAYKVIEIAKINFEVCFKNISKTN